MLEQIVNGRQRGQGDLEALGGCTIVDHLEHGDGGRQPSPPLAPPRAPPKARGCRPIEKIYAGEDADADAAAYQLRASEQTASHVDERASRARGAANVVPQYRSRSGSSHHPGLHPADRRQGKRTRTPPAPAGAPSGGGVTRCRPGEPSSEDSPRLTGKTTSRPSGEEDNARHPPRAPPRAPPAQPSTHATRDVASRSSATPPKNPRRRRQE